MGYLWAMKHLVVLILTLGACGGGDKDGRNKKDKGDAAVCGDEVIHSAEACDDGNLWGGDGCSPTCTDETGPFEEEPNNGFDDANDLGLPLTVMGSLPTSDRDCFSVSVPDAGAIRATVTDPTGDLCSFDAFVEVIDSEGARLSAGVPDAATSCASIEPDTDIWARYLPAGDYAVCVGTIFYDAVPTYVLDVEVLDSCSDLPIIELDPSQDMEADGIADVCDDDDDNDGIEDGDDNCPESPNGPIQPFPWDTSDEGFVGFWMILGPFTTGVTPGDCEPSPDSFAALNDADAAPVLGDDVGDLSWFAHYTWPGDSSTFRYTDWFAEDAPREAYAATWVYSPEQRDAELAVGVDDGMKIWLNGVEVGLISSCQGIGTDAFRFPVTLDAGWNRLLHKVYDGGGGWGQIVRFYEDDGLTPMTDLGLSLAGPTDWVDNQGDLDGDGIGDLCDPEP